MEHHAAPENLRGALLRERGNLPGVLPAQLAVDHKELREGVPLGLHFGRALEDCRDDTVEELVVEWDPAALEWFRERRVVEIRPRRVARLVAREKADWRVQVL